MTVHRPSAHGQRRPGRVLWLLNHQTLMPFEVSVLRSLGFEVYVPKIVPQDTVEFRSCRVDPSLDAELTLAKDDLDLLNGHSFYDQPWSAALREVIARSFDIVITAIYPVPLGEAMKWFPGPVVARVFGLARDHSYSGIFRSHFPAGNVDLLKRLGRRFWLGQGYAVLSEVEDPWIAERAITLPVGLADQFFTAASPSDRHDPRILLACSNIGRIGYYRAIYDEFKRDFGDLPHVIVGVQSDPVDDTAVTGYVSDEELRKLYRTCRVFYYHSHEPRHLHYSPLEAMCHGLPVVFPSDGLLARLAGRCAGQFSTLDEARRMIVRLLDGDVALHDTIVSQQSEFVRSLSRERLLPQWTDAIERILAGGDRCKSVWKRLVTWPGRLWVARPR